MGRKVRGGAIEQPCTEPGLKLPDQDADGGLRQLHAIRRGGDAVEAAGEDKGLDLAQGRIDDFHS